MKSFLQTTEWLKFQESIGHKTWRFDDGPVRGKTSAEGGSSADHASEAGRTSNGIRANIIQHKIAFGRNYLYIPHGPEISFDEISGGLRNEVNNFIKYLKELAKENKSIFVKFEPLADVVVELVFRKGIKRSKKQLQPSRTVIINLGLSEEELLSRMHHKTRYNIKVADKHGITVRPSNDLDVFWKLLEKTSKRDKFYSHTEDYYKKLLDNFDGGKELKTELFLAYKGPLDNAQGDGVAIAGVIIMSYGDTVYYLHGAMDRDYKELMAPYFMHWAIIKWAKASGHHYYDLWGIDAQKWPGVTRFKLGWLGSPKRGEGAGWLKEYPGSFDIVISKFWYFIYNLARRIF